ncbi:YHS domain-containing protein [Thermoleophilia bacterium SCSIO 60948]|nr:YHS domain-containing protein [Thermoleophilia bacterium SCSIO 60948]
MSPICPTCGCSLVRLGIKREEADRLEYRGEELLFCCAGCVEAFREKPDEYLAEVRDWIVCPTCLAEKPKHLTVSITHGDMEVHFCRCPCCTEEFRKRPDDLLARLAG